MGELKQAVEGTLAMFGGRQDIPPSFGPATEACAAISTAIDVLEKAVDRMAAEESKHSVPSGDQHTRVRYVEVAEHLRAALNMLDDCSSDEVTVIASMVTSVRHRGP